MDLGDRAENSGFWVLGFRAGCSPQGQCVFHLSTTNVGHHVRKMFDVRGLEFHVGGCQNYRCFVHPYNDTAPSISGTQKGTTYPPGN